jgi:hypothetical protein
MGQHNALFHTFICRSSAYKHQHVHPEDLRLQVLQWGGRYFVELMLMFGVSSSAGIYDQLAKVFLWCCMRLARMPRYLVEQHLDDVIAVGPPGPESCVHRFFSTYVTEAEKVGVRLDKSGNREKCQAPDTQFVGLGVCFNTESWTWWIESKKLARILNILDRIRRSEEMSVSEIQSITGKLVDVRDLIPGGRYNLLYFLLEAHKEQKGARVVPDDRLRSQAHWWVIHLQAMNLHSPIIHPDPQEPSNALQTWTDAAGGSADRTGAGLGGLLPPCRYFYMPWPQWINLGFPNEDGVVFKSKLTCLEMLGPLVILATMADEVRGKHVICWVDNQGSCDVYRKGHSTKCVYTSCIAKACYDVAEGLETTLTVRKIRRCSDSWSVVADAISKGDFAMVKRMMPRRNVPEDVPQAILDWISRPREDQYLGDRILRELRISLHDI